VDVSKLLLNNASIKFYEAAKNASIQVFAVDPKKRALFVNTYVTYCNESFYLKLIKWR
jgi:hypothetical protein